MMHPTFRVAVQRLSRGTLRIGVLLMALTFFTGFTMNTTYAYSTATSRSEQAQTVYRPCQVHEVRVKFEGGYFCLAMHEDGGYLFLQQVCAGEGVVAHVYKDRDSVTTVSSNSCANFYGPSYVRVNSTRD